MYNVFCFTGESEWFALIKLCGTAISENFDSSEQVTLLC